jgi:F-type H+-transporting ATPase subunit delta
LDDRAAAVSDISKGLDPTIQKFLGVLVLKRATAILPQIVSEYRGLLDQSMGRIGASTVSASPVSAGQKARLEKTLSAMYGKSVIVDVRLDHGILGGLVVRVGDQVIDGSVRTRIDRLRQRLEKGTLG